MPVTSALGRLKQKDQEFKPVTAEESLRLFWIHESLPQKKKRENKNTCEVDHKRKLPYREKRKKNVY